MQQVYLKADSSVYKFGITKNPERRHKDHKRTHPEIEHVAEFFVKDREAALRAEDLLKELTSGIRAYGNEWCVHNHDVMFSAWNQVFSMFEADSEELYADWEWDDGHPPEFESVDESEFLAMCLGDNG